MQSLRVVVGTDVQEGSRKWRSTYTERVDATGG